jgi:hypothetical protein
LGKRPDAIFFNGDLAGKGELIMSCIRGKFFSSPAAIPSTHPEATGQPWPAPITPTARRRRSANTP